MTPQVSGFIPGLLEDMDKYIEVADGYHVMSKQKRQAQIKVCNDNRDNFIATLHNALLAPVLCDMLFLIITLTNLWHTCLFHKWFCTVYFGYKEKYAVTLPHGAQRKHTFLGKIKRIYNSNKISTRKKFALELLHHRLGHIYIR